ncbi:MAG: pyridoxal phosphate-dependent aminotransferase [Wenzhouxiangellaceae bacterium]|nr:pyridoxal phosphate-dependent aminotransferase [Wenzhouxiangellaceae bacterium]
MQIARFETEHFFARYEFNTPWQLCNSDCESISIADLLELAGDSLETFGAQRLGYTQSQGQPELRAAIAGLYERVRPADVVVLGTPVEGIYLAARTLLNPGDEAIVLSPGYDALLNLARHVAGPGLVNRWTFHASGERWELDLDELRRLITPRTRLLVLNFPHNPTGYLPSPDLQRELGAIVEQHGLWLFSDEMYFGLVHSGTPPVASAADTVERSVVLSGLSKTHGLPGLRCGWLIVRDASLRDTLMNWKYYTSICPPAPSEYLASAALRVHEQLCRRSVDRIEKNLALATAFFARWPELFRWRPPLAGSTALVGVDVPSVSELSHTLAREEGILIQSAQTLGGDDRHMRLGLGRDGFGAALDRFDAWLQQGRLAKS